MEMDIVGNPHLLCRVTTKASNAPGEVGVCRDLHRTLPAAPHPWGGMGLGHRGSAGAARAEEEGDGRTAIPGAVLVGKAVPCS